MALTLSSLLAVPSGNLSPSFEDDALYSTELFSGDLSTMEDHGGKAPNEPLFDDDTSFLTNNDLWSDEWSALPPIASSTGDIPDLSLFCEPEMDPSLPMPGPYVPTVASPVSADVYPPPTSSPPISSPPVLSPVLSPEEQIQNIIMYLEDDTPSSVESTGHTFIQSPTTPLHMPVSSPTTPLHTPTSSPNPSPAPLTVPQKRSLYEEPGKSPSRPSKKKTPTQKKLRKKEQNKTAALRYRQRKREELQDLEGRQQTLESINKKLRSEVNGLEAEIKYLKQLWRDVASAKRQ